MSTPLTLEQLAELPPEQVPLNSLYRAEGRIVGPKWPIALVAMMAALIAVLDVSIVNVALPSIRASIGASLQETSWISTGYMVSNVVIIPLTGFFQRRIGFRNYFAGSLILFTVSSLLCSLSWNLWSLVVFRMLQGLGGGALIPTASSIMLDRFPREERTMALATFGLGAMMGPMLGPALGGYLTDTFSWHWIFLINLPIGIVELVLIVTLLREDRSGLKDEPVDWVGISFLIGWLSTMQYVLEEGNGDGWLESDLITYVGLASISFFVLFVHQELTTEHPVVKLRFFKDAQYTAGTLVNMGLGLALFSSIYLFSLYSGVVLRYSAGDTGQLVLKAAVFQGFFMPLIGRFGSRFDQRVLVGFGVSMLILSLYQYTRLTGQESSWDMLLPQLLRASGMAFIFIPVSGLAIARIPTQDLGDATGLFSLTRELGGSVGTAILATLITRQTVVHQVQFASTVTSFSTVATARLAGTSAALGATFGDTARGANAAYASLSGSLARQALILAFNDAFAFACCIAVGMLVLVLFMQKPTSGVTAPVGH